MGNSASSGDDKNTNEEKKGVGREPDDNGSRKRQRDEDEGEEEGTTQATTSRDRERMPGVCLAGGVNRDTYNPLLRDRTLSGVTRRPDALREKICFTNEEKSRLQYLCISNTFYQTPFTEVLSEPKGIFYVANPDFLYEWSTQLQFGPCANPPIPYLKRHTDVQSFLTKQFVSPTGKKVSDEYDARIRIFVQGVVGLITRNELDALNPQLPLVRKTQLVRASISEVFHEPIEHGDIIILPIGVPYYRELPDITVRERTFMLPSISCLKIVQQAGEETDAETITNFLAHGRVSLLNEAGREQNDEGLLCEVYILRVCDDTPKAGSASSFGSFRANYLRRYPNAPLSTIRAKYTKARLLFG